MSSESAWHDFGHLLAPEEPWEGLLEKPGLLNVTVQGVRTDDYTGHIQVQAQPSKRIQHGVHLGVNDHYQLKDESFLAGATGIMEILRSKWIDSQEKSKQIINNLMERQ
jgi:hypothetical protein